MSSCSDFALHKAAYLRWQEDADPASPTWQSMSHSSCVCPKWVPFSNLLECCVDQGWWMVHSIHQEINVNICFNSSSSVCLMIVLVWEIK